VIPVVICSHRHGPLGPRHPWVRAVFTKPVDPAELSVALSTAVAVA
jgi:hypothetical protein